MSEAADFFGLSVPFLKHLGVKAEMAEGGRSRISLELRPELLNSFDLPPHASDFKFTPDGKRLLAKRPQTPELQVLNPDRNSSP